MRYWHRLCAPIFAALLLVIALSGVITRVVETIEHANAHADHAAGARAKATDQPGRTPLAQFGHLVKDIHSGEALGPLGTVLSLASGLALAFFSVSGFWMYLQMWRRRRRPRG